MSYYETATDGLGSYYETGIDGLGSLDAATSFPPGSEFGVGYTVRGLAAGAAPGAVQILRDSVAYGFRGSIEGVQWGPAFGVPSGVLAVKIRTGVALTGAQLNSIFSNIGITFQTRLRSAGSSAAAVTNSHLHQLGAGGNTSADVAAITSAMTTGTTPASTIDPSTGLPYETMLPATDQGFFSQSVGGIPMWVLLGGGVVALGAIGYVLMSKPKSAPAAVKANRRRSKRKRGGRRGGGTPGLGMASR